MTEPTHPVTRQWLIDMLSSLNEGDIESCRTVLEAAIRIVEGGDWPEELSSPEGETGSRADTSANLVDGFPPL